MFDIYTSNSLIIIGKEYFKTRIFSKMAKLRDRLINRHSNQDLNYEAVVSALTAQDSDGALSQGEIAVLNHENLSCIVTLDAAGTGLIKFPSETKVNEIVNNIIYGESGETSGSTTSIVNRVNSLAIAKLGTPTSGSSATYQLQGLNASGTTVAYGVNIELPLDKGIASVAVGQNTAENDPVSGIAANGLYIEFTLVDGSKVVANADTFKPKVAENDYIQVGEDGTIELKPGTGGTGTALDEAIDDKIDQGIQDALNPEGENSVIADEIAKVKVQSSGQTITVSNVDDGSGKTIGTNIEVNIDGKTITKNDQGVLSVDFTAMVEVPTGDTGGTEQKPALSIVKLTDAEEGFLATYQLQNYQGTVLGQSINIPKDYLVKSAELKECEVADQPVSGYTVGQKYIDFTVNSVDGDGNETHLYLLVNDLVDVYTGGNGIEVSDANVISAKVVADDKYITVDANGIHVKPTTGATSGATAIDDAISTAVETAKGELQDQIEALETAATADKAAMITAVTADTTQPISAVTADSESGKTVTLSLKVASDAAAMKAAAFADNDEITADMLENRLMLTADGSLFVSNVYDGGILTV